MLSTPSMHVREIVLHGRASQLTRVLAASPAAFFRSILVLPLLLAGGGCGDREGSAAASLDDLQALYDEARSVERRRLSAADSRSAEELYQHVVQTDSSFAPGWAGLARVNAIMVHFMYDPSEERRRLSREAAETALRLAPDAAESHHALAAYWYWGEKDYDRAAAELTEALESAPDNSEIHVMLGYVERRRGEWEAALGHLQRAAELDPTDVSVMTNLAGTYEALGRPEESAAAWRRASELLPDGHYDVDRSLVLWRAAGATDSLVQALQALPQGFDPDGRITRYRYDFAYQQRQVAEALAALETDSQSVLEGQGWYYPMPLLAGRAHQLAGDETRAQEAFEAVRSELERTASASPADARVFAALGRAYAGLGRDEEAVQAAERALALMPRSRDAFLAPQIALQVSEIYAVTGRQDQALDLLTTTFSEPVPEYSRRQLDVDPAWDALRSDPRFREIAAVR